jgi:hypothetical protein
MTLSDCIDFGSSTISPNVTSSSGMAAAPATQAAPVEPVSRGIRSVFPPLVSKILGPLARKIEAACNGCSSSAATWVWVRTPPAAGV